MGTYINRGNSEFRDIVTHEYVYKTSLIPLINATLNSENRYSCVTRCHRFCKSMAAKMLCAYYDKSCDSRELFVGVSAEKDQSFLDEYVMLLRRLFKTQDSDRVFAGAYLTGIQNSKNLLAAILSGNEQAVAQGIEIERTSFGQTT